MGHLVGRANTILSLEYDGLDHLDLMQDNIGHDTIEYCNGRLREWRPHNKKEKKAVLASLMIQSRRFFLSSKTVSEVPLGGVAQVAKST